MKVCSLIISALLSPVIICGQIRTEVFTWHADAGPVALYDDTALTDKRIDIYPDINENMAGCIVCIDAELESCLRVAIEPLGIFFVKKGSLAVNTRNYDNDSFFLYEAPDMASRCVFQSTVQQTVIVYGVCNGWLWVEAKDQDRKSIRGWLPPNMQCGNPYTTCG